MDGEKGQRMKEGNNEVVAGEWSSESTRRAQGKLKKRARYLLSKLERFGKSAFSIKISSYFVPLYISLGRISTQEKRHFQLGFFVCMLLSKAGFLSILARFFLISFPSFCLFSLSWFSFFCLRNSADGKYELCSQSVICYVLPYFNNW